LKPRYGSPALAFLLRLKLRGLLRRQWRRMRTPKGFALTLIGLCAFELGFARPRLLLTQAQEDLAPAAAGDARALRGAPSCFISLSTALTNRGLYLPRTEIERLFSAPVSRADLVCATGSSRTACATSSTAASCSRAVRRVAHASASCAFAGIMLALQTLPVVNQILAISLGGIERRAADLLRRGGSLLLAGRGSWPSWG
jgi:hypothetical protein